MWYCNSAQNRGLLGEVDCTKRGRRSFPDCARRGVRVGGWVVVVVVVSGSGGGGEGGGGGGGFCSTLYSRPLFCYFQLFLAHFRQKGPQETQIPWCAVFYQYTVSLKLFTTSWHYDSGFKALLFTVLTWRVFPKHPFPHCAQTTPKL